MDSQFSLLLVCFESLCHLLQQQVQFIIVVNNLYLVILSILV